MISIRLRSLTVFRLDFEAIVSNGNQQQVSRINLAPYLISKQVH